MRAPDTRHFLALATGLLLAACASAETSPYSIGVSETLVHDSNLLNLGNGLAVPDGLTKADLQATTSLFAGLDQPFGRQRLRVDAALRDLRFAHNERYNSQGYALSAGLDWETVERLSGTLSVATNRGLAAFSTDGVDRNKPRNLETTRRIDFTARLGGAGRFGAEAGIGRRSVSYTAADYAGREFHQTTVSTGFRFRPREASLFRAGVRLTEGRYPQYRVLADGSTESDRFKRHDLDLSAALTPSGLSRYDVRLSYSQTSFDTAAQRDYSGLTGAASWTWLPTGKLRFVTTMLRDAGQDNYFNGTADAQQGGVDYSRLTTSLAIKADYELSAKISLNGSLSLARRSLVRSLTGSDDSLAARDSDSLLGLAIGAAWQPTRSVRVGCDVGSERQSGAATLSANANSNTLGCYGRLTLQ